MTVPDSEALHAAFCILRRALGRIERDCDGPAYGIALDALEATDAVAENVGFPREFMKDEP